jgi:hypothetical protein
MPNTNDPDKPKPAPGKGGAVPGSPPGPVKKPGEPPKTGPTPDGDDKPPQ